MKAISTKMKSLRGHHVHLVQSKIHQMLMQPWIMDRTQADGAASMEVAKVTKMQTSILDVEAASWCRSIVEREKIMQIASKL